MVLYWHSMALVAFLAAIVLALANVPANAAGAKEVTPGKERLSTLNREVVRLPSHVTVNTLFLIRHAKSSRDDPMLPDKERPLNDRGKRDAARDQVTVHYSGWTTDGRLFDSSISRGQPTTFALYGVIPGWTEGLQLMVEGEGALLDS